MWLAIATAFAIVLLFYCALETWASAFKQAELQLRFNCAAPWYIVQIWLSQSKFTAKDEYIGVYDGTVLMKG